MTAALFPTEPAHTVRQPRSDRLFLNRFVVEAMSAPDISTRDVGKRTLSPQAQQAHDILIQWADLESSGQLARMNENQLQGEFFADVFGRVVFIAFCEDRDLLPRQSLRGAHDERPRFNDVTNPRR